MAITRWLGAVDDMEKVELNVKSWPRGRKITPAWSTPRLRAEKRLTWTQVFEELRAFMSLRGHKVHKHWF